VEEAGRAASGGGAGSPALRPPARSFPVIGGHLQLGLQAGPGVTLTFPSQSPVQFTFDLSAAFGATYQFF